MKLKGLKKYRLEKNIPQSVIADKLHISRYQYIKMEQSEIVPDKYIPLLSKILEYDFSLMTPYNSSYLQALRNISNISQKDVASTFGITQQSVVKQENGDQHFSYQKYKDTYFSYFKKQLANGELYPFIVKEVPGANILFYLDKCIILVDDEKKFDLASHLIDPDVEITIYERKSMV